MGRIMFIKKSFMLIFISVVLVLGGGAYTLASTIDINQLTGMPNGWDPTANDYDFDITDLDEHSFGNPGGQLLRFHVGLPGGISDLHIDVPAGQVPEPITLTQDLFANQKISGFTADMWGTHIPFCTYFTIDSEVSFDMRATVPEPATMLLFGLGLLGLAGAGRRKK